MGTAAGVNSASTFTTKVKIREGLTAFPKHLYDFSETLEIMDLTGNQLSSLPDDFGRFRKLKILFLSENNFTVFPSVLAQCENLEMIGFKANFIEEIAEDALPVKTRWLIMTQNRLSRIPDSIGKCHRMEKLMLAGNRLTEISPELSRCSNLALLRISANRLEHLPGWILEMPNLAWLAFGGNPFVRNKALPTRFFPDIDFERLDLLEKLGEGASGIIHKAIWKDGEGGRQLVAVKVFKAAITSDGYTKDEVEATLSVGTSPYLVQVIGKLVGHPGQKEGLVFSLIPDGFANIGLPPDFDSCSRDVMRADASFSISQTVSILHGVAEAARHLHGLGINHGDLYSHNILANEKGHPLFGDFGAAARYDVADGHLSFHLERIEARAFGYLMDDLMRHTVFEGGNGYVAKLNYLKEGCLHREIGNRFGFAYLADELNNIKDALKKN